MAKPTSLGERLIELRGDRSQSEWARQLGLGQQSISQWEADAGHPHINSIVIITEHEEVNLNWLVNGNGPKTNDE